MMAASTIPSRFQLPPSSFTDIVAVGATKSRSTRFRVRSYPVLSHCNRNQYSIIFKSKSSLAGIKWRSFNGDGAIDATPIDSSTSEDGKESSIDAESDDFLGLLVGMLGLDKDPLDRDQAIENLYEFSLGGKECVDAIMKFQGCLYLVVGLLTSESDFTSEAAAGLLRSVSSVSLYIDAVEECGAVEAMISLLSRPSLSSEVKEQCLGTLWNLSVDEKVRMKIADMEILDLFMKFLDDKAVKVREASGGVLANLALSSCNHQKLVEAGIIPKMATFLKEVNFSKMVFTGSEAVNAFLESKVLRKQARSALLELAKDDYYKILIIEEGIVPVPLVGAAAYNTLKPPPTRSVQDRLRYGASKVPPGSSGDKNVKIDKAKITAMFAPTIQRALAGKGALEKDDGWNSQSDPNNRHFTLLPWVEAAARLVLILELEDEVAISRAAEAIAYSSINEHLRSSFKEAGAIKQLIQLLDHSSYAVRCAVAHALERLSVSPTVCPVIEAGGAIRPLVNILKHSEISGCLIEKTLDIFSRILGTNREMESKKALDAAASGLNDNKIENSRKDELDSAVIARLVEILKTASPNLQRKAASVLELVAVIDPSFELIVPVDIASALDAVLQQKDLRDIEADEDGPDPVEYALEREEIGLTISAASRLLYKLLDSDQFCRTIYTENFINILRNIIKSSIPLNYKEPVAACLVKLSSLSGHSIDYENPIIMELTLYETIPRLVEQIKSSFSVETQEAAVIELNRIISKGVVDSTQAVASKGAIFPLVNLLEEGSDRTVEAALGILYNLSTDEENHAAIISAGAVPLLKRIIQTKSPQWQQALQLLRNLPV